MDGAGAGLGSLGFWILLDVAVLLAVLQLTLRAATTARSSRASAERSRADGL